MHYRCIVYTDTAIIFSLGTNVGLVVNNLGGTSNLELSLIAGVAIDYLSKSSVSLVLYVFFFV